MPFYLAKRIAGLVIVLLAMSFIVFCLQSVIPADPARAIAGPSAPVSTVEAIRQRLGLDQPVLAQYGRFIARVAQGDLGTSVRTRQPVTADIRKYLPASFELGLVAMAIGVALACLLALLQGTFPRLGLVRLGILAAGSAPIFFSAMLLVYFFWFRLGWLPGAGRLGIRNFSGPTGLNLVDGLLTGRPEVSLDALSHIILPALALAVPIAVAVGRSLGGAMHEVMQQGYIRTARGNGLGETAVLLRHGLRNAAGAPFAMIGLQVSLLFGNLLIVERVFAWPGLGLYMLQAFASADLPAVLGVSLIFGAIYILVNIGVEIAQSLADPRIGL
ncbi:peptide ABC transporter permease [Kaistia sp. 32K]|uniref:ABC transporter permease n=1 Tax=Kaistia sp. 32K TaxID=2795690 RepID=UPI0019160F13|nr:ABC transporter permease [Kaistia sp. 32K]BCP55572.1 peptide ABC transporter permease [Kaistia sp. 32K]